MPPIFDTLTQNARCTVYTRMENVTCVYCILLSSCTIINFIIPPRSTIIIRPRGPATSRHYGESGEW